MDAIFQLGDQFAFSRQMTPEVHAAFLTCSGDVNPLHVDDAYARSLGHPGMLMHGALLNAMVSGLVGTALPTRDTMCLSQKIDFRRPFYMNDLVELVAIVTAMQPAPFEGKDVVEFSLVFRVGNRQIATGTVEVLIGMPQA